MPRADLLALSPDDLAVLTNRGTVKRAQRELESGEVQGELDEAADGTVSARWSDGVECRLPAGEVVAEGRCTCAAAGLCRHIVRTVLAYRGRAADAAGSDGARGADSAEASTPPAAWDPGQIGDDALAAAFKAAALSRAREEFEQGLLVELVRGAKPSARFHSPPHTVRFLVPADLRYTHCDCAEPPPCRHVPAAVWAFRRLEPSAASGLVTTQQAELAVPADILDDVEAVLLEWVEQGLSGAPAAWGDRLTRLEARCRGADLVWPAEVIAEFAREFERYRTHDALFDPMRAAGLIGELVVRCDAIRSDTSAVPSLLVRGTRSDRPAEIGSARYVGLGCGVRLARKSAELVAYLQDADTGLVVAITREFADPPAGSSDPPRDFARLAETPVVKGASLAAVGAGQLLIQGAKRTPGHRLVVGRGKAAVNPQAFAWEQLRAPALAEDFDELRARLALLPPASLRPRRVAEDVHAVAVSAVRAFAFDAAAQAVRATVVDARGAAAELEHPYHSRGRAGVETLLARLTEGPPEALRFAAGPARLGPRGLVLAPTALVFQEGASRRMIQPWVARAGDHAEAASLPPAAAIDREIADPIDDYPRQLMAALGELILLGLNRADDPAARGWRELARFGMAIGFDRLVRPVDRLADALERKGQSPRWDTRPAAATVVGLAALARLACEVNE
jgi:hypothetical protein